MNIIIAGNIKFLKEYYRHEEKTITNAIIEQMSDVFNGF